MGNRVGVQARRWDLPVVANHDLGGRYRELVLGAPELAARMRPGQFVNVRCAEGMDPLLRRPFSVYRMDRDAGTFSLLYDVVGRGTSMMAHWGPGFLTDVLAPLGNWFEVPAGDGPLALVAGGVGVAPLVALAESLAPSGRPMRALLGARTAGMILCEAQFQALGVPVSIATDDASRGHPGTVADLLRALLDAGSRFDRAYACGPRAMMAAVCRVSQAAGIPCTVSMEVGMACGFGVCMGCAWRMHPEGEASDAPLYRLVCVDGPVFDAAEIVWE